jgi:hypothetical protein
MTQADAAYAIQARIPQLLDGLARWVIEAKPTDPRAFIRWACGGPGTTDVGEFTVHIAAPTPAHPDVVLSRVACGLAGISYRVDVPAHVISGRHDVDPTRDACCPVITVARQEGAAPETAAMRGGALSLLHLLERSWGPFSPADAGPRLETAAAAANCACVTDRVQELYTRIAVAAVAGLTNRATATPAGGTGLLDEFRVELVSHIAAARAAYGLSPLPAAASGGAGFVLTPCCTSVSRLDALVAACIVLLEVVLAPSFVRPTEPLTGDAAIGGSSHAERPLADLVQGHPILAEIAAATAAHLRGAL